MYYQANNNHKNNMEFIITTIAQAEAHGIEVLPTFRKSVDNTQVVLHWDKVENIDEFGAFKRYEYDSQEFTQLMNSEAWTHGEDYVQPNEDYAKVKAMQILNAKIKAEINKMYMSDNESLDVMEYFPAWENDIDVVQGNKYRDGDKLYEVDQSHHTQENWRPSIMSSLWHEVVKNHKGTKEDPIPYNEELNPFWQGMILEEGKYYTQSGKVYKCVRSSGIKLTHNLADLVSGGFVEEA